MRTYALDASARETSGLTLELSGGAAVRLNDWLDRVDERMDMEWQPIGTAPQNGKFYLVTDGKNYSVENQPNGCYPGIWHKKRYGWYGASNRFFEPTHWMPLPEPPAV